MAEHRQAAFGNAYGGWLMAINGIFFLRPLSFPFYINVLYLNGSLSGINVTYEVGQPWKMGRKIR